MKALLLFSGALTEGDAVKQLSILSSLQLWFTASLQLHSDSADFSVESLI